jgi:hypothetical protein
LQEKKTLSRPTGMRVFFLACALTATAFAQSTVSLQFDAASVRPNTLNDRIVTIAPGPGGRFAARGYSLKLLIQHAYGIKGYQVIGGPSWLDADRWDVTARGASKHHTRTVEADGAGDADGTVRAEDPQRTAGDVRF